MNIVDEILDTPVKRTLWFDLIPFLDEDDQRYLQEKFGLRKITQTNDDDLILSDQEIDDLFDLTYHVDDGIESFKSISKKKIHIEI